MNPWRIVRSLKIALLLFCCSYQQISARFIVKDLVLASILANILKPRIVPLPFPLPFPLKFKKHTIKRYPVPLYSHSLAAYPLGQSPYGLAGGQLPYGLVGGQLPYGLGGGQSLSGLGGGPLTLDGGYDLSQLSTDDLSIPHLYAGAENLEKDDIVEKKLVENAISTALKNNSNKPDNTQSDIEAVGGFDLLTDLNELGGDNEWW